MNRTDFSHPQRMSAGAFFILFTNLFVSFLAPIVTVTFYKVFSSSFSNKFEAWNTILITFGVTISLSLLLAIISYLPKKFYIKDGNLIFIHGLINHENTCVPLDRVHSLRTKKGIWYRLLGMRGIVFDTLATRQEEIELILDECEWQQLLSLIEKEEHPQAVSLTLPPEYNPSYTIHYSTKNLILAALCQNHLKGMAVLGSIIAVVLNNLNDLSENITSTIESYLNTYLEEVLISPLSIILLLATIYIVILLFWIGRVLLRYFDMTMSYDKKLMTFTYGMFTRSSCRFFYDKICTIWIKRNFLEKKFGFCTLMLRQALNASAQKEDDNMKLYGTDSSAFFLKWWLGKDYAKASDIMTAKSGRGVFFRSILLPIPIVIAVSIVLYHFQLYSWLILPLLYVLLLFPKGICAMRHSKITLRSSYFIIHNGAFAEISNFIKYPNLEVIAIRRTPLTKWFHRVSLVLSTSGTTFYVRSIKEDEAKRIYEFLLLKAEE